MRTHDLLRRLLLLLVLAGLAPSLAAAQAQHAVRADTLYTMTGDGPIVNGVVLIEGSTIAEVGPAADVDIPSDVTVHEATVATPGQDAVDEQQDGGQDIARHERARADDCAP